MADRPRPAPRPLPVAQAQLGAQRQAGSVLEFYRSLALALADRGLWPAVLGSEEQAGALAPRLAEPEVWAHFWAGKQAQSVPPSSSKKRPRSSAPNHSSDQTRSEDVWALRKLSFQVRRALLMCVADGHWQELLKPDQPQLRLTRKSPPTDPTLEPGALVGEHDLSDSDDGSNSPMSTGNYPNRNLSNNGNTPHRQRLLEADTTNPPFLTFDDLPSDTDTSEEHDTLPLLTRPHWKEDIAKAPSLDKPVNSASQRHFLRFVDDVREILDRAIETGSAKTASAKEQRAATSASLVLKSTDALRARILDLTLLHSNQVVETVETIFTQPGDSLRDFAHEVSKRKIDLIKRLEGEEQADRQPVSGSTMDDFQLGDGQSAQEQPSLLHISGSRGTGFLGVNMLHADNDSRAMEKLLGGLWKPGRHHIHSYADFLRKLRGQSACPLADRVALIRSAKEMGSFRAHHGPGCETSLLPECGDAANALPDPPWPDTGRSSDLQQWTCEEDTATTSIPRLKNDVHANVSLIGEIRGLRQKIVSQKGVEMKNGSPDQRHMFVVNEENNDPPVNNSHHPEMSRNKEMMRSSVALLLSQAGFTTSSSRALESLCDIAVDFIQKAGSSLIKDRDTAGRAVSSESLTAADAMNRIASGVNLRVQFPDIYSHVRHELPSLRALLLQSRMNVLRRIGKQNSLLTEKAPDLNKKASETGILDSSQVSPAPEPPEPMCIEGSQLEPEDTRIAEVTRLFGHFDRTAAIDVLGDGCLVPFDLSQTVTDKLLEVDVNGA